MGAKARGAGKGVSAFIEEAVDISKKGKSKVKTNGKTKDYTSYDTPEVKGTLKDMGTSPGKRKFDATGTAKPKPKLKKPVVTPLPGSKPLTTKQKVRAAAIGTGATLTAFGGAGVAIDRIRKRSHKVKSGDSLSKIAKQMGTTLKKLLQANNIKPKDANKIRIGQTIKVPPKGFALKSPKIYKGMSKSVMAKLHKETEANKAANRKKRLAKKHTGGRLGRMGGAGLSPAEMARAGVMSEAQRRREAGRGLYARKGGKVGKKKGGTVNRRGGGQIGTSLLSPAERALLYD